LGAALFYFGGKFQRGMPQSIAIGVGVVLFLGGWLVVQYARQENIFLKRPDPEKPPSILK
jgi:hypothetical protein